MAFDPAHPIHSGLPESDPVRENFVQLAVHHKSDTEPPAKAEGFIWWDTSEPANQKLRAYTGGGWVDLFDHMESTPASPLAGAVSWQEFVKDKDLTDPPGSPSTGDRYIVASVATGDWVGEENNIAEWDGSAWIFTVSEGGWVTWVEDETEIYVFNGASWVQESFGPHAASHTDGSDQLPNTNAGDVLIHNGSVWEDKQLAVKQSEYLVGPVGTAKYTLIQAAIDQAVIDGYDEANPTTVWILPGTYTEALSLKPGIYLSAVVDPLARGYKPEVTVTIVGVATFNYVDAGATYYPMELRGIKIEPTTGSPLVLSGSARKTVKMWSTWLETADADVIVFGTSPVESVEAYKSFIITTDGTKYVSQIGSGDSVTLVKSLASAVITSDMFQLDGTGRLYIYGNQISDSGSLSGCINVLATATSARLYIEEVVLSVDAARNHIQVDGNLLTAGLVRWHAIFNVSDENGDRPKIGGVNAADLLLLDPSSALAPWTQTIFVGKHGNDLNDGKNPHEAKLTFGAAITAAGTPASEAAAVGIVCLDDGEYTENLTGVSFVNIYAPNASLVCTVASIIPDSCSWTFRRVSTTTAPGEIIKKSSGAGIAYFKCDEVYASDTASASLFEGAILCLSGVLVIDVGRLYAGATSGVAAEGGTVRGRVVTVDIGASSNKYGLVSSDSGVLDLDVDSISGGASGATAIFCYAWHSPADVFVRVGSIDVPGTGISIGGGNPTPRVFATVGLLKGDDKSLFVGDNTELHLVAGKIVGTQDVTQPCVVSVVTSYAGSQIFFVGKHGSDDNSGMHPSNAFLTFGAAITAAGSPGSEADAVSIVCLDGGEYDEDLSIPAYTNIFAPEATLKGEQTLTEGSSLVARRLINDGDNWIIVAGSISTAGSRVEVDSIESSCTSTSKAIIRAQTGLKLLHVKARRIIYTGGAAMPLIFWYPTLGTLYVEADEIDVGTGKLLTLYDGDVHIKVRYAHGAIGVESGVFGGLIYLSGERFEFTTLYDLGASDELYLDVTNASGIRTQAAGAVVKEGRGFLNIISTTTVAETTLATIPIPDDTSVRIKVEVTAFRTNGADQATYEKAALVYRRSAGVATLQGAVQDVYPDIESDANWDATIDVDGGNNARVRVTGADSKDVNWQSRHTVESVG